MSDKLDVRGEYITSIYDWYEKDFFIVNRKYQRKLVWTLEEKRSFIDTIMRKYPVPIFLFVDYKEYIGIKEFQKKEIIDGLQRLDAIVSFINNEYAVKVSNEYQYFNLDAIPGKGALIREGQLEQKHPMMTLEICKQFMQYQLPVTTTELDDKYVEDIFRRINSTGRKLSKQDLRQAGVIGKFSDLVRRTASYIRGDYTDKDLISLQNISDYSLNNTELNYGVNINDIFWISQGIINDDGIRRSKDEEIITILYNCIISNYSSGMSVKTLDILYNEESNLYKKNEVELTEQRYWELIESFSLVISDMIKIFKISNTTFNNLLFKAVKNYNKDLVFIIIFLSLIQLKNEHYVINDYKSVHDKLKNIANKELNDIITTSECKWDVKIRTHLINRIKSILISSMTFVEKSKDEEWNIRLKSLLKNAEVEEQMYDFKIGITDLVTGDFNENVVPKIVKTLTAMANTNPGDEGFVVIGVSDNQNDSIDFEKHYSIKASICNNYYITGIKDEAIKYYHGIPSYLDKIKNIIEKEPIRKNIIFEILTNIEVVTYAKQVLLVLKLSSDKPVFYDKQLFVRYQSNNKLIEVDTDEYDALMKIFS